VRRRPRENDSRQPPETASFGTTNDTADLVVAEYDNSDFDYYYLEPGQWEIKDGSLNFRLAQDFEYENIFGTITKFIFLNLKIR